METKLSQKQGLVMSFSLLIPMFILAVYFPYVGQIGAFLVALVCMFTVYLIPIACYMAAKW